MFEYLIVAITKKGIALYKFNKLGTKFLDYYFIDFMEIESVDFGWGIIGRSMKIMLKDGNHIKIKAMTIGRGGVKLNKDIRNYIKLWF